MEAELIHVQKMLAESEIHKLELIVDLIKSESKSEGEPWGISHSDAAELIALFNENLESCIKNAALSGDEVFNWRLRLRLGTIIQEADSIRSMLWVDTYNDDDPYA